VRGRSALIGLLVAVMLAFAPHAGGVVRDDTQSLQAKLDAGGAVFLPKLPDGRCYATRGLWVSRDDTSISSDGACIVALGPGELRPRTRPGRPVRANAVFFVNQSNVRLPLPVRVTISGLRIVVPAAKNMYGISVFGHEVTLRNLTIEGAPVADVLIGSGRKGSGGMTARVVVDDSTLSGGKRAVIAASGPVGLRIEGNTLAGARGARAAGLHIRAGDRGQPTLDVRVARNRIVGNAGAGIFLDLDPPNGPPVLATGITITGNQVLRNKGAGIVVAGGQRDGSGELVLAENVVSDNHGPGLLGRKLRFRLEPGANALQRNRGGAAKGLRVLPPLGRSQGTRWVPRIPWTSGSRDDTAWLQARLDRGGGTIFLPRLQNDECYATRGLWVSHDDTTITSDGACLVSLGLGPVRLRSIDGDPIPSSAVFFVNRSRASKPAPVGVRIENLRIVVPPGQPMYGIAVYGHQVTLSHLDIGGGPKDDITMSGRANGNGFAGNVSVLDCTLSGANRNALSATSVIGLRIEGNTIQNVRDAPPGQPAAGIDVEADDRAQPIDGVRILRNTIRDNAGPGIIVSLEPNDGFTVVADELEIGGNTIVRNALKRTPPQRAGIVLTGGEDGGQGTLWLRDNVVRENGGPGILGTRVWLLVNASGNDLAANEDGPSNGL
jgi:hypothetical protein